MLRHEAIEKVLAKAASLIGQREDAGRPNRSALIDKMNERAHAPLGSPWCASTLAWCGSESLGTVYPVPLTADCDVLLAWGKRRGKLHNTAQRGDIGLLLRARDHDDAFHTFFATKPGDGGTDTTEGNTNTDGSPDGYKVCARHRNYSEQVVFVRWWELLDDIPAGEETTNAPGPAAGWTATVAGATLNVVLADNKAFIPFRLAMAALYPKPTGAGVGWSEGNGTPTWDNEPLPSAVPFRVVNGTSYVGARALAEFVRGSFALSGKAIAITAAAH